MEQSDKLSKALEELLATGADASIELENWDRRTRPGAEIRKNTAIQKLPAVTAAFQAAFKENVAKVFVAGDQRYTEEFSKLFTREGAFVLDGSSIYTQIAAQVEPKIGLGNTFGADAWIRLREVILPLADKYGVFANQLMVEPKSVAIRDFKELVALVKTIVRNAYGDKLNQVYLMDTLFKEAVAKKFTKPIAIFVVTNLDFDERSSLLDSTFPGQPSFGIDLDDKEPTKSFVSQVIRKIYTQFIKLGKISETAN